MLKTFLLSVGCILLFLSGHPQTNPHVVRHNYIEGHWRGAAIRGGNSLTHLDARIFRQNDSLFIFSNVPEWTYYPGLTSPIEREGDVLSFNTYLGKARLLLDTVYTELIGNIDFGTPPQAMHLKKIPEPNTRPVVQRDLSFDLGDFKAGATLYTPRYHEKPLAAIILVAGRGCGSRQYLETRAPVLARYGIAVVSYDKRGSEASGMDCGGTTIDELASDLAAVHAQVGALPEIDPDRVGFVSYSAGGWVGPLATTKTKRPVAFIAGSVTPSTSVERQQLGSAEAYVQNTLRGSDLAVRQAVEYTELMFAKPGKKNLEQMKALLKEAEKNNWLNALEDSDIPADLDGYRKLWVQRHAYDPRPALEAFQGPFLALLGEKDFIVPLEENVQRYREIFADKDNWKVVTLPETNHGLEHGPRLRNLGYGEGEFYALNYYQKADRVAPGAIQEIVDFLRAYSFLEEK